MAGGLMAIGPGHYEGYYRAAIYVDKILHGANPGDLAIAGPTQFTISVNRTALRNLGLQLPPDLADRINEWMDLAGCAACQDRSVDGRVQMPSRSCPRTHDPSKHRFL